MGIEFSVFCLPVPQPRQRHRVVRSGPKAYATNYTPAKHPVNGFKAVVALAARQEWKDEPLQGPVELRLRFRFPLPASALVAVKRLVGAGLATLPHITKPDVDNCVKSLTDCLTGICWEDDRQIAKLTAVKVYAKEPGVDVWVAEWGS